MSKHTGVDDADNDDTKDAALGTASKPQEKNDSPLDDPKEPGNTTTVKKAVMVPMTREQYEYQQSQVREVYDEESGRYRLVRGTGEIIERIVSRADHLHINQTATRGDGSSFAKSVFHQANQGRR